MRDVLAVAAQVQSFLSERKWNFAFIGGVANLAWGEIRTTRDVDVTLFTSFVGEEIFVAEILKTFVSRIPDPLRFALQARVLLLKSAEGIGIDIGLAGFPYEEEAVGRRLEVDFGDGVRLSVVTAEDLIVMKAFAGRSQDWADVEGVVRRQGPKLDWTYLLPHAEELAGVNEDSDLVPRLLKIRSLLGE